MLSTLLLTAALSCGQTAPAQTPTLPTPPLPSTVERSTGSTNGPAAAPPSDKNGAADQNCSSEKHESKEPHSGENGFAEFIKPKREHGGFLFRLYKAYYDQFLGKADEDEKKDASCDKKDDHDEKKKDDKAEKKDTSCDKKDEQGEKEEEKPRRALPAPFDAPPFPSSEYQGYPLIGVPAPDPGQYPFMKALYGANTDCSECIKDSRISFSGWVNASGNWSTAKNNNIPEVYWIVPNRYELDQLVFKLERYPDTVQTDHIDWGFRAVGLYGMDYRYTMAGGWGSDQLLKHNLLYGWDPTEVYVNLYIPYFLDGTDIRVGRWIACPDIETQYALDNFMGTHSILFAVDTYTDTGIMVTQRLNEQWTVQLAAHAGTDMAPWYKGSLLTGAAGVRWVACDNNDAIYAWVNAVNSGEFRHFEQYGVPLGHENFNYVVATWQHRFNKDIQTRFESYYMWERNGELGGTPSLGPVKPFGGGGGDLPLIPGLSQAYGVLNYTAFAFTKHDYFTLRNEWYRDETGFRQGARGAFTSHSIGLSHYFNDVFAVRPEIGYYRNWTNPNFDNGTQHGIWVYGLDVTLRF
jgi:hypothetical protein